MAGKIHPLVRNLYKRLVLSLSLSRVTYTHASHELRYLLVGRDYPLETAVYREQVKNGFRKNAHLSTEDEIVHAVARGRWYLNNEVIGVIKLRKYRTMRARYGGGEENGFTEPNQAIIHVK